MTKKRLASFVYDPALALYLPFDKLDSVSFRSTDAYGHLVSRIGAVWTPFGYKFDGVDDYITIPDATILRPTSFCIRIWANLADWTPASFSVVVSKSLTAAATSATFICAFTTGGLFRLQVERITAPAQYPTWDYNVSGFNPNSLHCFEVSHVRRNYNAGDSLMVIDGKVVSTTYTANSHSASAIEYAAYPIAIGAVRGTSTTYPLACTVPLFAYYVRARAAQEAMDSYQLERDYFGV